jgi:Tetraspanin family
MPIYNIRLAYNASVQHNIKNRMNRCPLCCFKGAVIISAILVMGCGVVLAYYTFHFAFSSIGIQSGNKKTFLAIGLAVVLIFAIISILGICAGYKARKLLTIIYVVIISIFIILAILGFSLLIKGKGKFKADIYKECNSTSNKTNIFQSLNKPFTVGLDAKFCYSDCPCASTYPFTGSDYTGMVTSESGPVSAINCPKFSSYFTSMPSQATLSILTALEMQFNCSGICSSEKFYMFSDVNRGIPLSDCKEGIIKLIEKYYLAIILSLVAIASDCVQL